MGIEGSKIVAGSDEQRAGVELLRAIRKERESAERYGATHPIAQLRTATREAAERAYDLLPIVDRQVRDAMDDRIAVLRSSRPPALAGVR